MSTGSEMITKSFFKVMDGTAVYLDKIAREGAFIKSRSALKDLNAQLGSVQRMSSSNPLVALKPDIKTLLEQEIVKTFCSDCEKMKESLKSIKLCLDKVNDAYNTAQKLYEESSVNFSKDDVFTICPEGLDLATAMYLSHQSRRILSSHYALLRHSLETLEPGAEVQGEEHLESAFLLERDPVLLRIQNIVKCTQLQEDSPTPER